MPMNSLKDQLAEFHRDLDDHESNLAWAESCWSARHQAQWRRIERLRRLAASLTSARAVATTGC